MTTGGSERHFREQHFTHGSSFGSVFPVDIDNPTVRETIKAIPTTFDSIFLSRGSAEQFTTSTRRGAIPLAPLMAHSRATKLPDQERRQYDNTLFLLRALTDSRTLSIAYLNYERSNGLISDFSLVVDASADTEPEHYYELRGCFDGTNDEESVFDITRHIDGQLPDSFQIEESEATDFVAAVNTQRGDDVYTGNLRAMLEDIMNTSSFVHHVQHGDNYQAFDNDKISMTVSREEIIERGISRLALYLVSMEEIGNTNIETNARMDKKFTLSYNSAQVPPYEATLDSQVTDPDGTTAPFERANQYETLSSELREHPEIIFQALHNALNKLAEF